MGFAETRSHLMGLGTLMALYLVATLYPFQWIVNGASREQGAAIFEQSGILRSKTPPSWVHEAIDNNELSVELEVKPFSSHQQGPARIFTVSRDHHNRNLTIGQEGRDLIIRLRRNSDNPDGTPPFTVSDVFSQGQTTAIAVSIRGDRLSVWIDGESRVEAMLPPRALAHWDRELFLALGNELTWERPWRGKIARAIVKTRTNSVDLLSSSVLEPPRFRELLGMRFVILSSNPFDLLANFLGFIAIGALSLICLPRASPVLVVLIWLPVCVTAELLQLFLEHRYSSLSDLALNLLGCAIGAGLLHRLRRETG